MTDDIPAAIRNGELIYRVSSLERDTAELSKKVDRLLWALVTLALSIAGSTIVFTITVLSTS